ncbi:MAG: ComEC/Rec2 family competence protein [Planctomycetes bacterium]|nr:ComEC/Rec2 family competence protein [Planctomycetota bacterium]
MQAAKPPNNDRSMPYRPLLLVAMAVGLGIVADRYGMSAIGGGVFLWWAVGVLSVVGCVVLRSYGKTQFLSWTLLLAALCVGGAWHHLRWNYFAADDLARFAREAAGPVCVEAVVTSRTKQSPAPAPNPLRAMPVGPRSDTFVRVLRIRDGTRWQRASGNCRLRVASELVKVQAGDRLRVYARFRRPRPALNPGQYDWAEAERRAGRHCELFCTEPECVAILESATSSKRNRWLGAAASRCEEQLARYVGAEESGLALAVLLGVREQLDDEVTEAFFKTGTIHLLVVSGLHVGMLALIVWLILQTAGMPRRGVVVFTALLVIAYAMIAGGRPPVVRATILVLMGLGALVAGRLPSMKVVLAAAALAILAYNPSELFRGGTQLSFLCVAALSTFGYYTGKRQPIDPLRRLIQEVAPWYRKILRWLGNWIGELAFASFVIWVVVAPLVAYHFHVVSPAGFVITPIIWPLIAGALIAGLGICTIGWVLPPVASMLGGVCAWCLGTTEAIVSFAEQMSFGHSYVPGPATWWLLVFYGVMTLVAIVPRLQIGWKPLASLATLWVAIGFTAAATRNTEDQLRCTFLAMGHGTCVVLELPGGQTLLYDAGSLGSPEGASQTIAGYLWSRGITRIDAVVLSHADVDHYNAMPGLLERFEVGTVYVSPLMFDPWATDGQLDAPEFLRTTLQEAKIPLRQIWMNDRLQVARSKGKSKVEIEVLHPPRSGVAGRDNANSLLLHVTYRGHSILLPGDLESPGLEAVLAEQPLNCDILLAPHHGSRRSDPAGFAAWCTPEWVVVSGPRASSEQQFTAASYRKVGAQVLHTANVGAVQFTLDSQGLGFSQFLPMK